MASRGFVIGTGDLSELALGWSTYNADHMSMYNPNAGVPKTLVKFLVEWVAEHYAPLFATWRIPVVVNVAGAEVSDYMHCVRHLDGVEGVAGVELNISCPNIAHGLDFGRDAAGAARLVDAVRAVTGRHVMVKLSPNVTDIGAVARAVEGAGADSVSAVNTYVGMKIHRASGRPVLPQGTGGLSGPAIHPLALAAVAEVRAAVRIPVVAAGGRLEARPRSCARRLGGACLFRHTGSGRRPAGQ